MENECRGLEKGYIGGAIPAAIPHHSLQLSDSGRSRLFDESLRLWQAYHPISTLIFLLHARPFYVGHTDSAVRTCAGRAEVNNTSAWTVTGGTREIQQSCPHMDLPAGARANSSARLSLARGDRRVTTR